MRTSARLAGLVPVLLAAGFLGSQAVQAAPVPATLYVDQSAAGCSDSGPGSQTEPFCTIQAAADVVTAGQTVAINGGSNGSFSADYSEAVTVKSSGTPSAPITFTTVQRPGTAIANLNPASGVPITLDHVHDVVISHLILVPRGNSDGADVISSQDATFDSLIISQQSTTGAPNGITIDGASSGVTISRSYIVGSYGYEVRAEPGAQHITVTTDKILSSGTSLGGISVSGASGAAVTSNSVLAMCGPAISVDGGASATVENNFLGANTPSATCTAPAAALSVSADSAASVESDYNAIVTRSPHAAYSWAGTAYPDAAAFAAGTGQGTHDIDATTWPSGGPLEGSPLIDSADCSAPGELATDLYGHPHVQDPLAAHTGTGTCYADRGAVERQDSLSASFTPTTLQGAAPLDLGVTAPSAATSPWNEPVTYTADFGEGGGPVTVPAGGTVSHTYATPGRYTLTFTAADTGGSGQTVTRQLAVGTAAPPDVTFTAGPDVVDLPGPSINPDAASFSISAGPDSWELASGSIAFGDGTSQGIGTNLTWTHQYPQPGTYTATLTETDLIGRTSTATATITAGDEYLPVGPYADYPVSSGAKVAAHAVLKLTLAQLHAAFTGVHVAALRVEVTKPGAAGSVIVYPDGTARPAAGSVDFSSGKTASSLVLARPGADQLVDFYNSSGKAISLTVDTFGIQTGGQFGYTYAADGPVRVLDTGAGIGAAKSPVPAGGEVSFAVAGSNGVPGNASAVLLDVTASGGKAAGHLTAYGHGTADPGTPDVVWAAGQTTTGLVVVPLQDGSVVLHNASAGSVSFRADLVGYDNPGGTGSVFLPAGGNITSTTIAAKHALKVQIGGVSGMPATGVSGVAVSLTASGGTAAGCISGYPDGAANPRASALCFASGQTVAGAAIIPVGADGAVELYNGSSGPVKLRVDLAGAYYQYPAVP